MCATKAVQNGSKTEELNKRIPPEGGWGYMMCIGLILVFVSCFAYKPCVGMIFNGFLEDLGEGIGGFSVVNGLNSTLINFSGIFTSILLKKFSLRKVGLFGGFIYVFGMFANCFVTSISQMIITMGILQGAGCGILITIGFTSFNQYFVRKRLMVMSTTKIFCALGVVVYPMLMKTLMLEYGWRGTNLIATGIDFHIFLGIALMQPIKWHYIRKENMTTLLQGDGEYLDHKNKNNVNDDTKEITKVSIQNESEKLLCNNDTQCDSANSQKTQRNENSVDGLKKYDVKSEHSLSIIADTKKIQKMPLEIVTDRKNSKWDIIVKYLDLDLLKDNVYINMVCGMSVAMNGESVFYMLLPLYLYFIKTSLEDVAICLSVVSVGDFLSRIVISIASGFFQFRSRSLFFCGVIGATVFKLVFIHVHSLTGILIVCGILGFFKGCMHIPLSLVYAEYSTEKFTAAYGLGHIVSAIVSAVITPIFGILKDYSGNYTAALYLNSGYGLFCIIPWGLEFWYLNNNIKK